MLAKQLAKPRVGVEGSIECYDTGRIICAKKTTGGCRVLGQIGIGALL